jgi:2-polyprenyl-3-methyl-5-hydroxy-6-metoxy-1,4-benzoquinol methylase
MDHTCENCGHGELEKFIDQPNHQLLHCPQCDLYQKGVLESGLVYEEDYHEGYASRLNSKIRTATIRLASIKPYLSQDYPTQGNVAQGIEAKPNSPIQMLDIGCSVGATLTAAKNLGWQPMGVDVSQRAAKVCKQRGVECTVVQDGELPFEDGAFDLVTNWHVIEHVLDVRQTLTEWRRVLKPGGIMILETPDASYLKARIMGPRYKKFWPAEHLYTFTRENLTSIMSSEGFEILPSRLLGGWNTLSPAMTAYALGYRSLRASQRSFNLCKSIEVCCRKPMRDVVEKSKRVAA